MDSFNINQKLLSVEFDCSDNYNIHVRMNFENGSLEFVHFQDCCEHTWLEDGKEELQEMVGQEIVSAVEVEGKCESNVVGRYESLSCYFYKIVGSKSDVTLRFGGSSNGFYNERTDMRWMPKNILW